MTTSDRDTRGAYPNQWDWRSDHNSVEVEIRYRIQQIIPAPAGTVVAYADESTGAVFTRPVLCLALVELAEFEGESSRQRGEQRVTPLEFDEPWNTPETIVGYLGMAPSDGVARLTYAEAARAYTKRRALMEPAPTMKR